MCLLVSRKCCCINNIEGNNTSLWGQNIWKPTCWRSKGSKDTRLSCEKAKKGKQHQQQQQKKHNASPVKDKIFFYCSQCLFILTFHLLPSVIWTASVSLHLQSYFRLTFRVSLRFISLFSSISSCSLRAAEIKRSWFTLQQADTKRRLFVGF